MRFLLDLLHFKQRFAVQLTGPYRAFDKFAAFAHIGVAHLEGLFSGLKNHWHPPRGGRLLLWAQAQSGLL